MIIIDLFGDEPTIDTNKKEKKEKKERPKNVPYVSENLQIHPPEVLNKIM